MKKKHGWNTWENYLRVHESVLKKYQPHFITQSPKYSVTRFTDQYYQLRIDKLELVTAKGTPIYINIEKDVEVQAGGSKDVARTVGYSYQAWIKGGKNLIRYCSPHESHNKFHHKHDYQKDPNNPIPINGDSWPHINEFLDELIDNF
jgi:hypothetical protein